MSWGRVTARAAQAAPLHVPLPGMRCGACSVAVRQGLTETGSGLKIFPLTKDRHPNGSLGEVRLFAVPCKSHAGAVEATEKVFV